jgi:hypothetical protein
MGNGGDREGDDLSSKAVAASATSAVPRIGDTATGRKRCAASANSPEADAGT